MYPNKSYILTTLRAVAMASSLLMRSGVKKQMKMRFRIVLLLMGYHYVVARYWLAGLVKQARGLTALCCPIVNCYRRLHSLSAPCKASASMDINDQNCSFHLKYVSTPSRPTCVQNRLPGVSANLYIVLAATVAAGLAGITNKYCSPERDVEVPLLPKSLAEALDALERDEVLLKALGVEFVRSFISMKRKFEVDVFPGWFSDETIGEEQDM